MKKGNKVVIYHDPFTRVCTEGKAVLTTHSGRAPRYYKGEEYQEWYVRFDGDEHNVLRKFSENDITKGDLK
jgi:hypothetical protein